MNVSSRLLTCMSVGDQRRPRKKGESNANAGIKFVLQIFQRYKGKELLKIIKKVRKVEHEALEETEETREYLLNKGQLC